MLKSEGECETKDKKRLTKSISKSILNERNKIFKYKFNKQMDSANSRKFCNEDNYSEEKKFNFFYFNNKIENTLYNSYVNSSEKHKNLRLSEEMVNYYLIKSVKDDEDLIFYNANEGNDLKYDENYKCYYSLDHKSRIIYIKPSPKLLSMFNSKIITRKTTHNISKVDSVKSSRTPNLNLYDKQENLCMKMMNFDHNVILEKLKNIELSRDDNYVEAPKVYLNSSSEEELSI